METNKIMEDYKKAVKYGVENLANVFQRLNREISKPIN